MGTNRSYIIMAAVFTIVLILTVVGVFAFFLPVTEGDATVVSVHPVVGVLFYVGACTGLYLWSVSELLSKYKGAFMLICPQSILIIDLMFRGQRGLVTTVAGITMLVCTWLVVAYIHTVLEKKLTNY